MDSNYNVNYFTKHFILYFVASFGVVLIVWNG